MKKENFLPVACLIIAIIVYTTHFLFYRNTFPEINIDEASFFSPAYSFAEKGKLSSEVHATFLPGSSTYTYWMPPFYMVTLGVIFKAFESSVFIAKLISFLCIIFGAILLSFISPNKLTRTWIIGLVLICPFIIISSAFIRMEAMAFMIVCIAIFAVKRGAKAGYLGSLAAFAIMTHPVLIACAAGLTFIAARRGFRPFIIFSLVCATVLSPYVYYIAQDFDLFKDQMSLQLIRKASRKFDQSSISYVAQSLPIALITMFLLWKIKRHRELKYFLLAGMALALAIVLKSLEFNYHIYLIPYVVAGIGLYLDEYKKGVYSSFVIPVGFYSLFALILLSKVYSTTTYTDKYYNELLNVIDNDKQWIGKDIYVYGIPDVSNHLIEQQQKVERQNAVANLKEDGWSRKFNYVIQVVDHKHPKVIKDEAPWLAWKNKSSYTSSDGHFTINTYSRD